MTDKDNHIKKLIIYEDHSLVLFNKPQGIPVTPGKNYSFCDDVFKEFPELKMVKGYKNGEGGLLNRLDNETGGIILFAKTNDYFVYYSDQMKKGKIEKYYYAIVQGECKEKSGIIDIPIAHRIKNRSKMTVALNNKFRGKPRHARTEWKLVKIKNNFSLLNIKITKGARHQIRVHLAYSLFPIAGDKLYSSNKNHLFNNHLLYAYGISFLTFEKKKVKIFVEVPFIKEVL